MDLDICYKDFPTIIKGKGLNGYGKEKALTNPPAPVSDDGISVEIIVDGKKYSGKLRIILSLSIILSRIMSISSLITHCPGVTFQHPKQPTQWLIFIFFNSMTSVCASAVASIPLAKRCLLYTSDAADE